ncbi:hypothetical protein HN51_035740 [Arachis hypogaea]
MLSLQVSLTFYFIPPQKKNIWTQELRGKFGLVAFFFFCFFNCAAVFGFRDKILLGVMDDDLLLMVRSGFAVAAVPVLENVSIPAVKKTKEVY